MKPILLAQKVVVDLNCICQVKTLPGFGKMSFQPSAHAKFCPSSGYHRSKPIRLSPPAPPLPRLGVEIMATHYELHQSIMAALNGISRYYAVQNEFDAEAIATLKAVDKRLHELLDRLKEDWGAPAGRLKIGSLR